MEFYQNIPGIKKKSKNKKKRLNVLEHVSKYIPKEFICRITISFNTS